MHDYYVAGRDMSAGHIGLSIVATDVGGGFIIPRIKKLDIGHKMFTYSDFLRHR